MYKTFDNVRVSLLLAWKYKILWVFGLLLSGSAGTNFLNNSNYTFDSSDFSQLKQAPIDPNFLSGIEKYIPGFLILIIILILTSLLTLAIQFMVSLWANGSLIDGTNDALDGDKLSLKSLATTGRVKIRALLNYYIRVFFYSMVFTLALILFPIVFSIFDSSVLLAISIVFSFIVAIVGFAFLYCISKLATRTLVLEDYSGREAFNKGFKMVKSNSLVTIKLLVAQILTQFGLTLSVMLILGAVYSVVFVFLLRLNPALPETSDINAALALASLIGTPLIILTAVGILAFNGFSTVFDAMVWTNLFRFLNGKSNEKGVSNAQ
jgi:hypothetical protein